MTKLSNWLFTDVWWNQTYNLLSKTAKIYLKCMKSVYVDAILIQSNYWYKKSSFYEILGPPS